MARSSSITRCTRRRLPAGSAEAPRTGAAGVLVALFVRETGARPFDERV